MLATLEVAKANARRKKKFITFVALYKISLEVKREFAKGLIKKKRMLQQYFTAVMTRIKWNNTMRLRGPNRHIRIR